MTIDISKVKPGDKVTLVPLEVLDVHPDTVKLRSGGGPTYATADMIAAHHPAPREIGVGDRVRGPEGGLGTVRAIDEEEAWIRWDGSYTNWGAQIPKLTLVEGDHERA